MVAFCDVISRQYFMTNFVFHVMHDYPAQRFMNFKILFVLDFNAYLKC